MAGWLLSSPRNLHPRHAPLLALVSARKTFLSWELGCASPSSSEGTPSSARASDAAFLREMLGQLRAMAIIRDLVSLVDEPTVPHC